MRNALVILCLLATPASAQGTHDWQTYANGRFGYAICYPADLLTPQPEAENGDGRVFTGSDGASLRVYGLNNALGDSLAQAVSNEAQSLGGRITYRVVTSNAFVLSGRKDADIFYEKTWLIDDQFKTFVLTYPASLAATYNPVAARLSGCFRGR